MPIAIISPSRAFLQNLNVEVMHKILNYAKAAPIGYASPEGYSRVKKGMSN